MKIHRTTWINPYPRDDGARQVAGYYGQDAGWLPMGVLMPEITNHVSEQPKSLAEKLIEARGVQA